MKTDTPDALLMSAPQVAQALNISRASVYEFMNTGRLPMPVKIGGCTRWRADELARWIQAGCPHRQKWQSLRGARP